ncbi:unnamed protein product [Somion occarium]|uniref:Transmembrane protein n=1 Tax=Somion occarium TaxID=3059160 RepID=A0ABP1D274_9APHY
MRCCPASAARILTLFSLVVLASHSFTLVNAQSSPTTSVNSETGIPSPPIVVPSLSSSPSSLPTPSSSPPATQPSQKPSPETIVPPSTSTVTSDPPTPSSASPTSTSATITSQSTQDILSSSSSLESSSSASSSSSSGISTVSSSSSSTAVITPSPTPAQTTGPTTASYRRISSTHAPGEPTDLPEPTGALSEATSKGFFSNKGAVAGTFTVVAIVAVVLVIAVIMMFRRRLARRRDEEDEVYFEKYREPEPEVRNAHPLTNLGGLGQSATNLASHASPDSYPDRNVHYGHSPTGDQAAYDYDNPQEYGMEYPPGTAYAAAVTHPGQYQYGVGPNLAGHGAGAYDSIGGGNQYEHQGGQTRTSPGPFADPGNSARHPAAPPVNQPYADAYDAYTAHDGYAQPR